MKSREYYKSKNRFDRTEGCKQSTGKNVIDEPNLIIDIIENMRILENTVRKKDLENGINWYLGFDSYVKDKKVSQCRKFNKIIFRKGEIITVDFFGHFGTELTYEHPAIILKDTYDGIIIAPISSSCFNDNIPTHISLQKNISDIGGMKNNCGIKLEQIRFISKNRIIYRHGKVSNTKKLDEIDNGLMKLLSASSYNRFITEIQQLSESVESKSNELEEARNDLSSLQEKLEELENKMKEYEKTMVIES